MLSGGHFQALEIRDRLEYLIQIQILGGWMFGENAEKLVQHGLSIIPTKGKIPQVKKWQNYCSKIVDEQTLEEWEEKYASLNIGLCTGEASGVIALDIDTDDKAVLDILPKSAIVKRGQKGETRFFKYNPKYKNITVQGVVELLTNGRQTIIPPSIHPETGESYVWVDQSLENKDELEELPGTILTILESLKNCEKPESIGRKVKLFTMISQAVQEGETDDMILESIVNYDDKHHSPPWFKDSNEKTRVSPQQFINNVRENHGIPNPNVYKLTDVSGALAKEDERLEQEKEEYYKQTELMAAELAEADQDTCPFPYEPLPKPAAGSMLDLLYRYVMSKTYKEITAIAVAGATAITDLIFARKFRYMRKATPDVLLRELNIWPHSYNICFARSGRGKDAPTNVLDELSNQIEQFRSYIGLCGTISTAAGLYRQLQDNNVTLFKDDEIGNLFHSINEYKRKDLALALCDAFTKSKSTLHGNVTKESKKDGVVLVHNPALIMLGFTTKEAFEKSAGNEINEWGLIPRMNIFTMGNEKLKNQEERIVLSDKEIFDIQAMVRIATNEVPCLTAREVDGKWMREAQDSLGLELDDDAIIPHEMGMDEQLVRDVLAPFELWADEISEEMSDDHIAQRTMMRATEKTLLHALRHRLSRFDWLQDDGMKARYLFDNKYPNTDSINIEEQDLDYGIKMFKHSVCNLCVEGGTLKIDSPYARLFEKIKGMIYEAGSDGLMHGTITNRVRNRERNMVLQDLISSGQVLVYKDTNHGRRRRYVWSEFIRTFEKKWSSYARL